MNIQEHQDYIKIFGDLPQENVRVKQMLASKKFYALHPEMRPDKKQKKVKEAPNNDIYNLLELHGADKLKKLIDNWTKDTLRVDFVNGKSIRTRNRPSKNKIKVQEEKEQ